MWHQTLIYGCLRNDLLSERLDVPGSALAASEISGIGSLGTSGSATSSSCFRKRDYESQLTYLVPEKLKNLFLIN